MEKFYEKEYHTQSDKAKQSKLDLPYIYEKRKVSQQDISYDLRLSRPTVITNLNVLESEGMIRKSGQIDTEFVGRKAAAYSIVSDFRVSIGVEILRKEIKMIAIDLYGDKIDRLVFEIAYENQDSYYRAICDKILEFKELLHVADAQLLGIGFSMQGLVSPDRKTIVYGEILGCTGITIEAFTKYLPYACSLT